MYLMFHFPTLHYLMLPQAPSSSMVSQPLCTSCTKVREDVYIIKKMRNKLDT